MSISPTSDFAKRNAIVFPDIRDPSDLNWVKASLLLWDKLYYIAEGNRYWSKHFNELEEAELLHNLGPEEDSLLRKLEKLPDSWGESGLDSLSESTSGLSLLKYISELENYSDTDLMIFVNRVYAEAADEYGFKTLDQFVEKWKTDEPDDSGPFISALSEALNSPGKKKHEMLDGINCLLRGAVSTLILSFFIASLSRVLKSDPLTPSPSLSDLSTPIHKLLSGTQVESDIWRSPMITLSIPCPSMKDLKKVKVKKLIRFRERTIVERKRFRAHVGSVLLELSEISDSEEFNDVLSDKASEIKQSYKEHLDALDELQVKSMSSLLTLRIPSMLGVSWLAKIHEPVIAPIAAGVGIAIGGITWWAENRAAYRKLKHESPLHYVLELNKLAR